MARLPSLGEWITRRSQRTPDRVALVFEDHSWSYADLDREIERVTAVMAVRGVGVGDRVAYLGVNHPALLTVFFACARLGAAITPINWRLAEPEVRFIIEDSEASLLVYDEPLAPVVELLREDRPSAFFLVNDLGVNSILGAEPDLPTPDQSNGGSGDDMVTLMYTSGTSGRPKGAMISHDNMIASIISHDCSFGLGPGHVALVAAPLFHIGGLNVNLMNTFLKGGTVVLERGFDPARTLEVIPKQGVNSFFAAPVMLQMLASQPDFADADLSSVQWIYCGGSPAPPALVAAYAERGISVCQGLGMTEATPMVATTVPEDPTVKAGSVGKPGLLVDVRIVDDAGQDCAVGDQGEIVIRGANVIVGYWNRPEENSRVLRGGWFHTGDVGVFDEDGYLYVVDRLKDMIISGGENIASAEVEACLLEHPAVAAAAVVGKSDEKWGEVPVTYVVPAPRHSIVTDELRAHAAERLARFKQPVEFWVVPELPRNAAGKVLKHELRRMTSEHSHA